MLKDKLLWVLSLLLLLTVLSWAVSVDLPLSNKHLGTLLLVVAFIKVRLIIMHFMEANTVHGALRFAVEAWIVLVGGITVFLNLFL